MMMSTVPTNAKHPPSLSVNNSQLFSPSPSLSVNNYPPPTHTPKFYTNQLASQHQQPQQLAHTHNVRSQQVQGPFTPSYYRPVNTLMPNQSSVRDQNNMSVN